MAKTASRWQTQYPRLIIREIRHSTFQERTDKCVDKVLNEYGKSTTAKVRKRVEGDSGREDTRERLGIKGIKTPRYVQYL